MELKGDKSTIGLKAHCRRCRRYQDCLGAARALLVLYVNLARLSAVVMWTGRQRRPSPPCLQSTGDSPQCDTLARAAQPQAPKVSGCSKDGGQGNPRKGLAGQPMRGVGSWHYLSWLARRMDSATFVQLCDSARTVLSTTLG